MLYFCEHLYFEGALRTKWTTIHIFINSNRIFQLLNFRYDLLFHFCYEPHPLAVTAAQELQYYIETQSDWTHNFGLDAAVEGLAIGKMFGVLVVRNQHNELGYLAAVSGKLAGSNKHRILYLPSSICWKKTVFS
jgi:hypothetical protein